MSISVDAKLLRAAVEGLGLTVPIRSARMMADGRLLLFTRDGRHVWEPPKPETPKASSKSTCPERSVQGVSEPRARRKRATPARKTGGKK